MMPSSTSSQLDSQLYVQQLRFRHPTTSKVYRCVLNGFLRFVSEQAEDKTLSRETIREWVKDRILVWPFHLVAHRARLVDRFLDWAITQGAIGANPLGDLRKEYGQRTTTPVVRALLAPEFETALEALRPAPRFGSFFGPTMREHVEFMRAMGYRYNVQEERMLRLDRFLQSQPDLSGQPLTVLIRQWTCAGSTAQHTLECHLTGRLLSRAMSRTDPMTETIPWDKRIAQEARKRHRQPYLFSEQEIRSLLETALSFPLRSRRYGHNRCTRCWCWATAPVSESVRLCA